MQTFKDMVVVKDKFDREASVLVIITAPDGVNALNLQELAQQAWQSVSKEIRFANGVTARVRALRR